MLREDEKTAQNRVSGAHLFSFSLDEEIRIDIDPVIGFNKQNKKEQE